MKKLIKERGNSGNFNDIDTSSITDLSGLFLMSDFNGDISKWDVSNVTNMVDVFAYAHSFNQDISSWDVSNVICMGGMFWDATSFNQDISSWDVSNVTDMRDMFLDAKRFNQDLSSWDVSNVKDMECWLEGTPVKNKFKTWFPEFYI
jgi:surface protein